MTNGLIPRPPIGFIVEGHGEFEAFRSMTANILCNNRLLIPISNVRGIGNLTSNLSEKLRDFLILHNPQFLYICIDLNDVIKAKQFNNCKQLFNYLQSEIQHFENDIHPHDSRLNPLPDGIGIIIQIPKFESWMLSDFSSLATNLYIEPSINQIPNVDDEIHNPNSWIKNNFLDKSFDPKNPRSAKILLGKLNPVTMQQNSRSFKKYYKEITRSYKKWLTDNNFS